MQRVAEPTVGGVPGQDDGLLARGPGDRALPGIVLPCSGVVEPFLVVAELTKRAGREDLPEPRLAETRGTGQTKGTPKGGQYSRESPQPADTSLPPRHPGGIYKTHSVLVARPLPTGWPSGRRTPASTPSPVPGPRSASGARPPGRRSRRSTPAPGFRLRRPGTAPPGTIARSPEYKIPRMFRLREL